MWQAMNDTGTVIEVPAHRRQPMARGFDWRRQGHAAASLVGKIIRAVKEAMGCELRPAV